MRHSPLAAADATVTGNGNPAYALATDDLAYFFGSDDFDNSFGGGFAELEVSAVVSDGANDLVSVATNRVFVPPANETYAYDADGNQTFVTTGTCAWQVEYNGENRPVRWTCGDRTLLMDYDQMGRRRSYVEQKGNVVGKRHVFTYDGYLQIARSRVVDADFGAGDDAFLWDPTEPVATRPLACSLAAPQSLNSSTFFYALDGNKNVTELIGEGGEIAAHYEYSSFGKVVLVTSENEDQSTANLNPYRFSSEYGDDALGLVYYNYRHYNPKDGRWMGRDALGEGIDYNLLFYCRNIPTHLTDNLGAYSKESCQDSELDTTIGGVFNVGIGSISIFYNNHLRARICNVCCDDGTKGQTITRETSNGGGGGGSWKFMIGPVPMEVGFSYLMSGGEVEFYDSCSGKRTFDGCKTVSLTISAGPSVMVGGVGFAVQGNLSMESTSCRGGNDTSTAVKGKLVFRICYLPGVCQTKDLWP